VTPLRPPKPPRAAPTVTACATSGTNPYVDNPTAPPSPNYAPSTV
jgi:hypothetical protein